MNTDRTKKLLLITSSASAEAPLLKQLQQAFPDIRIYSCPAAEGRIPPEAAESLVVFSDPESRTLFMANAQEQLPPRCVTGISLFTPDTLFHILEKLQPGAESSHFCARYTFADIIGKSAELLRLKAAAEKMADTDLSILIEGATGTGKTLFAHAIHNASSRADLPFVTVNLAAADAQQQLCWLRRGIGGGTVFLDHVDDASAEMQTELLSILETRCRSARVRLLAASSSDLAQRCQENTFRSDLYFRLREGYLYLPPLSERREDIPLLADYWAKTIFHCDKPFSPDVLELLTAAYWPGNVRELRSLVKFAVAVSEREMIIKADLPYEDLQQAISRKKAEKEAAPETDEVTLSILSAIHQLNERGEIAGRSRIYWYLKDHGSSISEYRIRKMIPQMAIQGLLSSGHGKYGLSLTDKGVMILEMYRQEG